MNDTRRRILKDLKQRLEAIQSEIETVADEERTAFDNLPEGIRDGERGTAMETAADNLDQAATSVADLISQLDEVIEP